MGSKGLFRISIAGGARYRVGQVCARPFGPDVAKERACSLPLDGGGWPGGPGEGVFDSERSSLFARHPHPAAARPPSPVKGEGKTHHIHSHRPSSGDPAIWESRGRSGASNNRLLFTFQISCPAAEGTALTSPAYRRSGGFVGGGRLFDCLRPWALFLQRNLDRARHQARPSLIHPSFATRGTDLARRR